MSLLRSNGEEDNPKVEELDMPVLGEIIASPILMGLAVAVGMHTEASKPADPCRAPVFRVESANIAALPGPNAPACKEAQGARAAEKKKEAEKR
jgi:hypothetical protein